MSFIRIVQGQIDRPPELFSDNNLAVETRNHGSRKIDLGSDDEHSHIWLSFDSIDPSKKTIQLAD